MYHNSLHDLHDCNSQNKILIMYLIMYHLNKPSIPHKVNHLDLNKQNLQLYIIHYYKYQSWLVI